MAGLLSSVLAGAGQGFSNATQQNNQFEINSINRNLDWSIKSLMDERIAERARTAKIDDRGIAKTEEADRYTRNRDDALADQGTAQENALALVRERNKGYATARASGGAKGMAGYTEWKKDNPDGTYEEFLQTVSSSKVNNDKQIADTAQKLFTEEKKNYNDKYTMDDAIKDAKKLYGNEVSPIPAPVIKTPKKPLSAF